MGVKLNPDGLEDVLVSMQTRAMLETYANRVLSVAKATAPVVSGAYRDSLHLVYDTSDGSKGGLKRARVRVASSVPYALYVESIKGTLGRAVDGAL